MTTNESPDRDERRNNQNERKIRVDEDWKARVKAEDAALDQARREEERQRSGSAGSSPKNLPPADFATLVGMLSTPAMVALGLLPDPATGKTDLQLPVARHFVDLLGLLEEKTKGNLTESEQRLLEETLHHLRLAFVERSKQAPVQSA